MLKKMQNAIKLKILFTDERVISSAQQKREVCLDAMKDIENKTCIRFKYKTDEWDYIYISQERGR